MSHRRRTVDALTIVVPLFGNAEEMMGALACRTFAIILSPSNSSFLWQAAPADWPQNESKPHSAEVCLPNVVVEGSWCLAFNLTLFFL